MGKWKKQQGMLVIPVLLILAVLAGCADTGNEKKERETAAIESETVKETVSDMTGSETQAQSQTETLQDGGTVQTDSETEQETVTAKAGQTDQTEETGGMFSDFYDFQNPDGTYSYYFSKCGLTVNMDERWYQAVLVKAGDDGATFYQKASYEGCMKDGYEGGRLFTLGASVNTDFTEFPSYYYIGFNENDVMNYFAVLPTDYQAYMEDEQTRAEYDELWSETETVLSNIQLGTTEQ